MHNHRPTDCFPGNQERIVRTKRFRTPQVLSFRSFYVVQMAVVVLSYADCFTNLTSLARTSLNSLGYGTSVCACPYDQTNATSACNYANVIKMTIVTTVFCNYAFTWNTLLQFPTTSQFSTTSDLIVYGLWTMGTCTTGVSQFCVARDAMTYSGSSLYTNIQISLSTSSSLTAQSEQSCIATYLSGSSNNLGGSGLQSSSISDLNECQNTTLNQCSLNADCVNTYGSYACTCKTGYTDRAKGFMRLGTACSSDCGSSYYWENTCINVAVVILLFLLVALQLLFDLLLVHYCLLKVWYSIDAAMNSKMAAGRQQQQTTNKLQQQKAKKNQIVAHHWVQTEKIFDSKFDAKLAKEPKPEVKNAQIMPVTNKSLVDSFAQTDTWSGATRVIYRDIGDSDYRKPGETPPVAVPKPITKNVETQTAPMVIEPVATLKLPSPPEVLKSPFKPKLVTRPPDDPIDIPYEYEPNYNYNNKPLPTQHVPHRPDPYEYVPNHNNRPLPADSQHLRPDPYEYVPGAKQSDRPRPQQPYSRRPRSNSADWMIPRPVLPQF